MKVRQSSVAETWRVGDTRHVRRGLLLGTVIGLLNAALAVSLAWWFGRAPSEWGWYSYSPMPRRYADYLPASSTAGWKIVLVLVATFLIVNIVAATVVVHFRKAASPER